MLHYKIKQVLQATGHRYPATWLKNHCNFGKDKAYKSLNGDQKTINMRDLSKLCENLNCTPNDLMYWEQTARTKVPETHPCMTQLKPPLKISDWDMVFKHLPADKVLELHEMALKKIEEGKSKTGNEQVG